MTKTRLIRLLTALINQNFFDKIDNYDLDRLLVKAELLQLPNDQREQLNQLHHFVLETYDGELDMKAGLLRYILDTLVVLKDRSHYYPLRFWLNLLLITDKTNADLIDMCCFEALRAKLNWTYDQDSKFVGRGNIRSHQDLEVKLIDLYHWTVIGSYDPGSYKDTADLNDRVTAILRSI